MSQINKSFSCWSGLLQGVPQGSVVSPILFHIYLNHLFYFLSFDAWTFPDDSTSYIWDKLKFVLTKLENNLDIAIKWLKNNYMKMNSDKCHLFISGHKFEHLWAKIGNDIIWETRTVKLLVITIDNELKFEKHLHNVCLNVCHNVWQIGNCRY